jgi:hypothetical protein
MGVQDLWLSSIRKGPDGKPLRLSRYGRGKRYRVYVKDTRTGEEHTEAFDNKEEAKRYDAMMRADVARGKFFDPNAGQVKVAAYAEQWLAGQIHLRPRSVELRESILRVHVLPAIGIMSIGDVRQHHIRALLRAGSERGLAPGTVKNVHRCLQVMFTAAVRDKKIPESPADGIRTPAVERKERFIPTPAQVHALADAVPARFRGAVYLAAGCGLRGGARSSA